jgi:hypothetical protein
MARTEVSINTGGYISLAAGTPKTILQLTSNTSLASVLRGTSVSFNGNSGVAVPVLVEICRQSDSPGSPATAALVWRNALETQTGFSGKKSYTTEPTTTEILDLFTVHPTGGRDRRYMDDEEYIVPTSGRIGVRCTAPAAVSVAGRLDFGFEEKKWWAPTFTVAGISAEVQAWDYIPKTFSLQVRATTGSVTDWRVHLELSNLTGANPNFWTPLLTHAQTEGSFFGGYEWPATAIGKSVFLGIPHAPALRWRINVEVLDWGTPGTFEVGVATG